jgi:hypothetical protein
VQYLTQMARARTLPPLDSEDPQPRHAMRGDWTDPDDIRPNASKTARKIHGWRTYDSLRRMSGHPRSDVTMQHIMAADKFREAVDVATHGYSSERPLIYVAQFPQPRWGLGPAAVAQQVAVRDVRRVMKLFSDPEVMLLEAVVLRNMSVRQWVAHNELATLNAAMEKRRLLAILDRLVDYYAEELKDDIAQGRRLTP